MYESYYGFREKPFSLLPDPRFFYISKKHHKTLIQLHAGVKHCAGITLITGEIGCGKTTLVQYLKSQLIDEVRVGMITNTYRGFGNLMRWVLNAFEIRLTNADDVTMHQALVDFIDQEHNNNRRSLLVVDEAQNLDVQLLEELRLLSNLNIDNQIFQVIIVGQPELRDILRRPDMIQFVQRIAVEHHVEPIDSEDTHHYIQHRISVAGGDPEIFEPGACDLIYRHSRGVPRLINSLSDTALLYGYDEKRKTIDAGIVHEIVFNETRYDYLGLNQQELAAFGQNRSERVAWVPRAPSYERRRITKPHAPKERKLNNKQQQKVKLIVSKKGKQLNEYPLQGDCLTIGRTKENDIHLPDAMVSRIHARILNRQDGPYIEDLTSVNGTFVNTEKIAGKALHIGDVISIGGYAINYQNAIDANREQKKKATSKPFSLGIRKTTTKERQIIPDVAATETNAPKTALPSQTPLRGSGGLNKSTDSPKGAHAKDQDLDDVLKTLSSWLD